MKPNGVGCGDVQGGCAAAQVPNGDSVRCAAAEGDWYPATEGDVQLANGDSVRCQMCRMVAGKLQKTSVSLLKMTPRWDEAKE